MSDTTTKFKGDIVFNDGKQDVKGSELGTRQWVNDNFPNYTYANKNYVSKNEVNEALDKCVKQDD